MRADTESRDPFFPKSPLDALRDGDYATDVPIMIGVTSQEGAWIASGLAGDQKKLKELNERKLEAVDLLLSDRVYGEEVCCYCRIQEVQCSHKSIGAQSF